MMETPTTLNSGMCRCCSSEGTFKDIKTKYHWMGEEEIYADMLNDCFDIKILTPEDTDNGICEVCITQLRNAANFKKQVLHTEEQFKQRFCNKDPKNPIKLESADDEAMGSDHLSDADFSGAEYEVPIKQEVDEKPKAKKRPAKATTSRTKKAKSGAEASDQRKSGERSKRNMKPGADAAKTPIEVASSNRDATTVILKEEYSSRVDGLDNSRPDGSGAGRPICFISEVFFSTGMRAGRAGQQVGHCLGRRSTVGHGAGLTRKRPTTMVSPTKDQYKTTITPAQESSSRKNTTESSAAKVTPNKTVALKQITSVTTELQLHMENLRVIMRCSNATPFKYYSMWYLCCFCSSREEDPAALKAHTLENHRDDKRPSVGGCISELVIRLDVTNLQCSCGDDIDSLEQLMKHLSQVHSERMYTHLKSYMVPFIFDGKELRCAICKVEFNSLKFLFEHMNIHFANFICDVCDSPFVNKRSLFVHVARHATGQHDCEQCTRVFATALKLQLHIKSVHERKKFNKCNYCNGYFSGIVAKNIHMLKMHGVPLPQLKCPACDKIFTSTKYLAKHRRMFHMMEKRHKCPECEKMFFSTSEVKRHMLTHSGQRDFQCVVCLKTYGRKNTLKEHMRIHADDRRFKCEVCGMAFVQKCSLKGHMRSKHMEAV